MHVCMYVVSQQQVILVDIGLIDMNMCTVCIRGIFFVLVDPDKVDHELGRQRLAEAGVHSALSVRILAIIQTAAGRRVGKPTHRDTHTRSLSMKARHNRQVCIDCPNPHDVEMAVLRIRYDGSLGMWVPNSFNPFFINCITHILKLFKGKLDKYPPS